MHAHLIEGTADWAHHVRCLGADPSKDGSCGFEFFISMAEIAEEGRLDLLDAFGLGAELEAIRREPPIERVADWDRLRADSG